MEAEGRNYASNPARNSALARFITASHLTTLEASSP